MTTQVVAAASTGHESGLPVRPAPGGSSFGGHRLARYAVRRLVQLAGSLVILALAAFALLRLIPGDPARAALGPTAPVEQVEARRHELGLDGSLWHQFVEYWSGLVHGDLGRSLSTGLPVRDVVVDRFPATLWLVAPAVALALVVALASGTSAAALFRGRRHRRAAAGYTAVTGVLSAMPEMLTGTVLISILALAWPVLPVAGNESSASYVLPVITLALAPMAVLSRIVREEASAILDQDFVRTARAKRLGRTRLYGMHVLPNAITASLTVGGLLTGALIAGTVLVETVFAWPGLGSAAVSSIVNNDYPLAQAVILAFGSVALVVNAVVDVVIAAIDPRSTLAGAPS